MKTGTKSFQLIWWGWRVWRFNGRKPFRYGLSRIYMWSMSVGPLEIRRWV